MVRNKQFLLAVTAVTVVVCAAIVTAFYSYKSYQMVKRAEPVLALVEQWDASQKEAKAQQAVARQSGRQRHHNAQKHKQKVKWN